MSGMLKHIYKNFENRNGPISQGLLKKQLAILLLSLLLSAVAFCFGLWKKQEETGTLPRNPPGEGEASYELEVSGLSEEVMPVTVTVSPQRLSIEEAELRFAKIYEEIEQRITEDGSSLDAVQGDLTLPRSFPVEGIDASWRYVPGAEEGAEQGVGYEAYTGLIDSDGKVHNDTLAEGEAVPGYLLLTLSCFVQPEADGKYTDSKYYSLPYRIFVNVLPRVYTREERLQRALEEALQQADRGHLGEKEVRLPTELLHQRIRFSRPADQRYLYLPLLGLTLSFLLYFREREERKNQKKQRAQQLLLDYSELVSKLNVYLGAGLTMRNAFQQISMHYDSMMEKDGIQDRFLFRELRAMCRKLSENRPESEVYREFSDAIALRPYTKLVSLIEQNRRNGTKDLRSHLLLEMEDAFLVRKNAARRLGEEASTKLLLPLLLQLFIVLIIVVMPAFTTF